MVLTEEQSQDLHKAVLAYLKENKFTKTFDALQEEVKLKPESKRGVLASKWRSIMKLNKQIVELEAKGKQLEEDFAAMGKSSGKVDAAQKIPRAPAKYTLSGHRDVVTCVKFHPAYGVVASCGEDALIKIWDAETGNEDKTLTGHQDAVQCIAFNPKGTVLASCSADLSIKLWDTEEFKCTKTIEGGADAHNHNISGIVFSKDGTKLISCSRDKTIKVWDATLGICRKTLSGHEEWVKQVAVSPTGKQIASCSLDQTIKVWSFPDGECTATLKEHEHIIETIAYSNTAADTFVSEHCLTETAKKEHKAARLAKMEAEGKDFVESTGRYLVSGSRDRTIKLWDLEKSTCVLTLKGHTNWVRSVVFHPGGQFIISASDDKTIRVWDLTKQGECVRVIDNAHDLFVSAIDIPKRLPLFASGGVDNMVKVWEMK